MWKLLYFSLFFGFLTSGLFADGHHYQRTPDQIATSQISKVDYVLKNAKNRDIVVLEGTFSVQIGDDEFVFEDGSGKIAAEISDHAGITPSISKFSDLLNKKMKIQAKVKKSLKKSFIKLKVQYIQITK